MSGGFLTAVLTYWPFVAMALIFYFMLYRPQKKEQKKREQMLNAVKKGDKVITIGGIHGIVAAVNKSKVTLIVAENVKIDFDLTAISRFQDQTKQEMASN
ncbi:MAG: preprotein translocase subunit YajC [Negativicutes bacterium]|nr:preprotein translocase subunit YajC [Negativicutes bacterium]